MWSTIECPISNRECPTEDRSRCQTRKGPAIEAYAVQQVQRPSSLDISCSVLDIRGPTHSHTVGDSYLCWRLLPLRPPCTLSSIMAKLPISFYRRSDVVRIARELLGKYLLTRIDGKTITGGIIVETEAYAGISDRASHAFGGRRTKRTETMFRPGGVTYVYLCYGVHSLLNIVTNVENVPDAVLIRAIEPAVGVKAMLRRRNRKSLDKTVAGGPGTLTGALGVNCSHDEEDLTGRRIWIEDRGHVLKSNDIISSPRVGVGYAGKDALRPWRFQLISHL